MPRVVLTVLSFAVIVYALVDCIQTPPERVRHLAKPLWLMIELLAPLLGAVAWLLVGRARRSPTGGRPRPAGPRGPDDDPDFLRGL